MRKQVRPSLFAVLVPALSLAGAIAVEAAEPQGAPLDDGPEPDLSECVALFVARLPSPYREAVTLTELQGLSQKEAAELVGVTLSGMKSRVQRGRERIRRMFEECCEIAVDCRGRVTECSPRTSGDRPESRLDRS